LQAKDGLEETNKTKVAERGGKYQNALAPILTLLSDNTLDRPFLFYLQRKWRAIFSKILLFNVDALSVSRIL